MGNRYRAGAMLAALMMAAALSPRAKATLIDVDYSPGNGPAQSGAAVLGASGDVWNNLSNSGTNVVLNDSTGTPTSATLTWAMNFGALDTGGSPMDAGTTNLMEDYGGFNGTTITIAGLSPATKYQLVLYGAGDQTGGDQGTTFTIPQTGGPSLVGLTSETFSGSGDRRISDGPGVAYTVLNPLSDATGKININVSYNSSHFSTAPVNGFQLATVPEPASMALLAIGGTALLARRRR